MVTNACTGPSVSSSLEESSSTDHDHVQGFISSGTYGRVYKARTKHRDGKVVEDGSFVAIKKFKPDKEGEVVTYTGISQSACREIMVRPSLFDSTRSTTVVHSSIESWTMRT